RHTAKAVLEANPYYWDTRYPSVETVTIYTQLNTEDAKNMALYHEGQLDITFIPFEDKVETIVAPYSKLVISPSTDNIAIHLNLRNGHRKLLEKSVRRALNQALHQRNLLHFAFEGEGELSPTMASPYFPGVKDVVKTMKPYSDVQDPYSPAVRLRLKGILEGLNLKVLTQDRFLTLWRGIEYQLRQVGVTLDITVTTSEKDIFGPLLKTNARQNTTPWDLLVWGDDDWYFNHPLTAFFVYRTHNVWSTVFPDPVMDAYLDDLFRSAVGEPEFTDICRNIMQRAYDEAYMLFVPTPNKVFAVNKEVVFHPYKMASIPLWEIQVTDQHWSVRQAPYPDERKRPIAILRENVSVSPTSTHTEEAP
ncbi:MAG: ABC transporter substrate-binding protein, partial [bacterium]|nr:ABC transporter substrate-binding protein [bacterium]